MSASTRIVELDLSTTCRARIEMLGVETLSQLLGRRSTEGLSPRDVAELRFVLTELGHTWAPEEVPFVHVVARFPADPLCEPAPAGVTVEEMWRRIELGLTAFGPKLLSRLGAPASEEAVLQLERKLGVRLPDDVRASYLIHDGSHAFVGSSLDTLEEIASAWGTVTFLHEDGTLEDNAIVSVAGPVKPVWWSRRWIPLFADGAGNSWCVDLDPDTGGAVGQVIQYWHDEGRRSLVAADFKSVLASAMQELESRTTSYGPIVYYEHDDGTPYLAVPDPDIDLAELFGK